MCKWKEVKPANKFVFLRKEDPMGLTKAGIVETIYNELGFPRNQCIDLVETLLEITKGTLASGEEVLISGFGKFCVKEKTERKGRNPATGDDLMLAPRRVVTFKCSGNLRDRINR
jgi:integration host factor subunit alpha